MSKGHDPQQEYFGALLVALREQFDTYDGELPPDGTPYPFVYIGDVTEGLERGYKNAESARLSYTVHVWHDDTGKRGTLSSMIAQVIETARNIEQTSNYRYTFRSEDHTIMPDNSTSKALIHGIVTLTIVAFRR